jgi:hypothetical protein
MTDSPVDATAGKTPLVQSSVKADTPRDSVSDPKPVDPKAPGDPYAKARELRSQADALEAAAPPTDEYVRLKVEPPHVEFGYGGVVVGTEWTAVHSSLAPGVLSAAAGAAGVTITQEGA